MLRQMGGLFERSRDIRLCRWCLHGVQARAVRTRIYRCPRRCKFLKNLLVGAGGRRGRQEDPPYDWDLSLLAVPSQCLNLRPLEPEPPLYCTRGLCPSAANGWWRQAGGRAAATSWSCIERAMAPLALLLTTLSLSAESYRQRGLVARDVLEI